MTIGERIRHIRRQKGMTQKQVADACGMADSAIRKYESGTQVPKIETLCRIAAALDMPITELIDSEHAEKSNPFWTVDLNDKLRCVGCSYKFAEAHEEYFQWIEYPDGTLEVTDEELQELHESTNSYLRFKLQELREKHKSDFKPKRK